MTRAVIVLFCLAMAMLLVPNRRRTELNAGRTMSRFEMSYHLPRLGDAKAGVLERLGSTLEWTWIGTSIGLVIAAIGVWFFPDASTAGTVLLVLCAWVGGQVGHVLGSLRHSTPGEVRRDWRSWVPRSLQACWVLAGLLVLVAAGFVGVVVGQPVTAAGLVLGALALAGLTRWGLGRALAARTLSRIEIPLPWDEALRGDAVRAATTLGPAGASACVAMAAAMAAPHVGSPDGEWWLIGLGAAAGLLWIATLLVGQRALAWHAAQVQQED